MAKQKKSPKKTILVIEDDRNLLFPITKKLEQRDYKVLTAAKVDAAISQLKKAAHIDVIWLDHYLQGDEDGIDFTNKIRKNKKYKSIPIFVISASTSDGKVLSYLDLGVYEHFGKTDYSLDEIIDRIEICLK